MSYTNKKTENEKLEFQEPPLLTFAASCCLVLFNFKQQVATNSNTVVVPWPSMQTDATLLGPPCCVRLHGTTTMLEFVSTCCA